MKSLFLVAFLLAAASFAASAANFVSTQSGLFSSGSTWVGGNAPSANLDTWTIASGHTVTYDFDASGFADGWGASTNSGTLLMTNGIYCYLKMSGNLSGLGVWRMGSASTPIGFTSTNTPGVICEFTGTGQCTMSGTNCLQWFGDTNHCFSIISSNFPTIGDTSITFPNSVPNIVSNDVFFLPHTDSSKAGQANQFYVVSAVSNNVVYLQTNLTQIAAISNTWPGAYSILTNVSINTSSRTTNTMVSFCSLPIVFLEKSQRAISTVTAAKTNSVTGMRVQNLGRGLATTVNGWTVNSCAANLCAVGGFSYNNCTAWTVNNSMANSCANGGFGNYLCTAWTVNNSTANSCNSGGFGYNTCHLWTVNNSTANSCNSGGFGYNTCYSWNVNNSTANSCANGGFANNACTAWVLNNATNNSSYSFYQCSDGRCYNFTGTNAVYQKTSGAQYSMFQFDNNYFLSDYGYATNSGSAYAFYPSSTNGPIPVVLNLSVRPNSTRRVTFSAVSTNNIVYQAGLNLGSYFPSSVTTFCTGNSGNITNYTLTVQNTTAMPNQATLLITATGTNFGLCGVSLNSDETVIKR